MPIYEYECPQCGERFEKLQAYSEDGSQLNCPKCQAANPRKLFSSFSARISGSNRSSSVESCPACGTGFCNLSSK